MGTVERMEDRPRITSAEFQDGWYAVQIEAAAAVAQITFSARAIKAFEKLEPDDLAAFEIDPVGGALLLKSGNAGVTVRSLVAQCFGIHDVASVAALGGAATAGKSSPARAAAASKAARARWDKAKKADP